MNPKTFTGTVLDPKVLEQDMAQADTFYRIAVGRQCIYYTGVFKVTYVPFSEIVWAYMRQEDCSTRMCCGRVDIASFFLMVTTKEGRQKKANLERAEDVKAILELLRQRVSGIEIGYSKERVEKYLK